MTEEKKIYKIASMNDCKEGFIKKCKVKQSRISTGIKDLDVSLNGGLENEFYIIGAETSTGKSALMMHMAQKMAESGVKVLYFALEMKKEEFIGRGISAISYEKVLQKKETTAYTTSDILSWRYDNLIDDFVKIPYEKYSAYVEEYFQRYGTNLYVIENEIENITAKTIYENAKYFREIHSGQVVICIDYLQIIAADKDDRSQIDRKTKIDNIVMLLKLLASQLGMPVLALSSISRSGYRQEIKLDSFKESGNIEYCGSIVIGWTWDGVTNQINEELRKEEIEKCRERGWRRMKFQILKYRNSERDQEIEIKYYPAFNYFSEFSDEERYEDLISQHDFEMGNCKISDQIAERKKQKQKNLRKRS